MKNISIETVLYLLLLITLPTLAQVDMNIPYNSYIMYEGQWTRLDPIKTNITQIPLLQEFGFKNLASGLVECIDFEGSVFLVNIYDTKHINHLVQLVFQYEDENNV